MKLRTRLFVIVGALFFVAFAVSYFVEEYFTKTNLVEAEKQLEDEIRVINEMKRQHFEMFLRREVSEAEAKIDAVLAKIARFPHLREGFAPNNENETHQTWLNTASLKITNPWIDFVQNLDERAISASIIVDSSPHKEMHYYPVNDELVVCAIKREDGRWEGPFMGVRVHYDFAEQVKVDVNSAYYALFSPESLLRFDPSKVKVHEVDVSLNFLDPFIKWIEIPARKNFMQVFLTNISVAQVYLQKEVNEAGSIAHWKEDAAAAIRAYKKNEAWVTPGIENYGEFIAEEQDSLQKQYFEEIVYRYDKVGMTWGLSTLIASGAFGYSPFGEFSPKGIGHILLGKTAAEGLLTDEVFLEKPVRPEVTCTSDAFKKRKVPYCLPNDLSVIETNQEGLVFIANTLLLQNQNRNGSLTIGIDSRKFLQDIARAAYSTTAFVSKGKIVQAVNAAGDQINSAIWSLLPIKSMLNETTGVVPVEGEEYFFLHIQPYPNLDFHFFVFKPKEKEYELLDTINRASKQLIHRISSNVRYAALGSMIIVLFILHYIARSITRPISRLAEATKVVAKGKLEDIEIPKRSEKRKDEVGSLYHSFFEMVEGLKEKEKVRGILNKVVSPEIAKEALKGNIHLGGEEREVTVLFADVRNFTGMTEKMPPSEVIELLNGCMTKISHEVDAYGGVIDKYVGDEVMALFGAPVAIDNAPQKAVEAAISMKRTLLEWNKERMAQGKPEVRMGFGVHTGPVVAGNMGAENRLNYTVLGANVNLAARLCSHAQPYVVLISRQTLDKLTNKELFTTEPLQGVTLKGFSSEFEVFKVDLKEPLPPTK